MEAEKFNPATSQENTSETQGNQEQENKHTPAKQKSKRVMSVSKEGVSDTRWRGSEICLRVKFFGDFVIINSCLIRIT